MNEVAQSLRSTKVIYPRLSPNLYPIKAVSLLYIGLTKTTALGRPADTVEEWN